MAVLKDKKNIGALVRTRRPNGSARWSTDVRTNLPVDVSPSCDAAPIPPLSVVQIRTRRVTTDELRDMLVRNPSDAARWIETAAKAGMAPAQIVWAQLLLDGKRVARDAKAAFEWFQKAAAQGDIEARNMVGRCYEQGWGVAADPKLATESFEIAAHAGHAWGQVNLAQMLMRAGDLANRQRCYALFQSAAESGTGKVNLKAMNSLARFLGEGWAGPRDLVGAVFWYLKAAKLGDHWAQYNLATILFSQGDHETAKTLVRNAIAISDNGFRRRIASLLLERPEPALRQLGLDALARCSSGNAPEDLYAYGLALDQGVAGPREPHKAITLFKAAAAKGHALACAQLRPQARFARFCFQLHTRTRTAMARLVVFIFQNTIHFKELS